MSTSPLLEARGLSKSFLYPEHRLIFQNLSLAIYAGESVAIVGRSGEGKSTLLQLLGTLDDPSEGTLLIDGEQVTSANRCAIRNAKLGFVFQAFHLLEDYTALENVLMPAAIARLAIDKKSLSYQRAITLLSHVGLTHRAHDVTKRLSGGERQRVATARALMRDPLLLLADEPSGNLDQETAHLIHQLLINFSKQPGKGLILVTHDNTLAQFCTRRLELQGGRLEE